METLTELPNFQNCDIFDEYYIIIKKYGNRVIFDSNSNILIYENIDDKQIVDDYAEKLNKKKQIEYKYFLWCIKYSINTNITTQFTEGKQIFTNYDKRLNFLSNSSGKIINLE